MLCLVSSWRSMSEQEIKPRALCLPLRCSPQAGSLCSPFLPACHWIHRSVFIPFPSLLPCLPPSGLEKDQWILHQAMHPPKIPSQRSIPPTSSLRAQLGAGPEPPSCSRLSSKYPIKNKPTNTRPDATTALQNRLSGSPAAGLGVAASLPHPGSPCLPRVIKPINGSHGP